MTNHLTVNAGDTIDLSNSNIVLAGYDIVMNHASAVISYGSVSGNLTVMGSAAGILSNLVFIGPVENQITNMVYDTCTFTVSLTATSSLISNHGAVWATGGRLTVPTGKTATFNGGPGDLIIANNEVLAIDGAGTFAKPLGNIVGYVNFEGTNMTIDTKAINGNAGIYNTNTFTNTLFNGAITENVAGNSTYGPTVSFNGGQLIQTAGSPTFEGNITAAIIASGGLPTFKGNVGTMTLSTDINLNGANLTESLPVGPNTLNLLGHITIASTKSLFLNDPSSVIEGNGYIISGPGDVRFTGTGSVTNAVVYNTNVYIDEDASINGGTWNATKKVYVADDGVLMLGGGTISVGDGSVLNLGANNTVVNPDTLTPSLSISDSDWGINTFKVNNVNFVQSFGSQAGLTLLDAAGAAVGNVGSEYLYRVSSITGSGPGKQITLSQDVAGVITLAQSGFLGGEMAVIEVTHAATGKKTTVNVTFASTNCTTSN